MTIFERRLRVPVSREVLHDWHMRDGVFERLTPPWEQIRSILAEPVRNGAKRIFEVKKGGLWMRWIADHRDVVPGERFTDVQEKGPFKRWEHTHRFEAITHDQSELVDHIEYELPLGGLGNIVAGRAIEADLEKMFAYRHRTTLGDLQQHQRYGRGARRRIAITGASGLIGAQLVGFLRTGGHEVLRLVRAVSAPKDDEIIWSPSEGVRDLEKMEGLDAVIHLAGANVGQKWTESARREIIDSRVKGTRVIVDAIGRLANKPRVFLGASAIGYYGDTGAVLVDEATPHGSGFLAEVCEAWEAETRKAEAFCRTARMRIGVVLDPRGGALEKLLPIFKAGVGGPVGSGEQFLSWIGLDDVLGAFLAAIADDTLHGALNVTAPTPVTQADFARTLGRVLSRPAIVPVPATAVDVLYGEMGRATVLSGTRALPKRLLERGYTFRAPELEDALRHCLGRRIKA